MRISSLNSTSSNAFLNMYTYSLNCLISRVNQTCLFCLQFFMKIMVFLKKSPLNQALETHKNILLNLKNPMQQHYIFKQPPPVNHFRRSYKIIAGLAIAGLETFLFMQSSKPSALFIGIMAISILSIKYLSNMQKRKKAFEQLLVQSRYSLKGRVWEGYYQDWLSESIKDVQFSDPFSDEERTKKAEILLDLSKQDPKALIEFSAKTSPMGQPQDFELENNQIQLTNQPNSSLPQLICVYSVRPSGEQSFKIKTTYSLRFCRKTHTLHVDMNRQ